MAKGNDQAKAVEQMQALNANPVMSVKEFLDAEGNMTNKEVEITPSTSSSVEYCVDSKGQIKPKVKVYHEDARVAFDTASGLMAKALEKANQMSQD